MARTNHEASPWAHGVEAFAGIMLIIGGAFQVIQAIAAIVNDEYLLRVSPGGLQKHEPRHRVTQGHRDSDLRK